MALLALLALALPALAGEAEPPPPPTAASGRARSLARLQAEVQELVAEARPLQEQLRGLRPGYGLGDEELAARREPLSSRLQAISERLFAMNDSLQSETMLYDLEAGTSALGQAVGKGDGKAPPRVLANMMALEAFHTEYWEFTKAVGAFVKEDAAAFAAGIEEARGRRRRLAIGVGLFVLVLAGLAAQMRSLARRSRPAA